MAKVSICIPSYNNALEVKHLLESIFAQDYKDIEINLSDDSNNNEIEVLVESYQERFKKEQITFHYMHNEKPLGHIFNWNAAIGMATGEYIKIMFSDDWFTHPNSLASFVRMLDDNPKADIAFSGSRQVLLADAKPEEMKRQGGVLVQSSYDRCASEDFIDVLRKDYRYLFLGNQIGAPSAVIYRRTKKLALFDEKSNWASDMFLYFDILKDNPNFVYSKEPLISIGVHEHQYTESFADKDIRIYNDYRYLYTKYRLVNSEDCKKYFLNEFIVKYHKGMPEAKLLGITIGEYMVACLIELKETMKSFVKSKIRH